MCSLPDDRGHAPPAPTTSRATLTWRFLVDEPLPGAANMARDHALAALARPGTGTLRFYRWSPATLSLGRNEPVTRGYRELLRRDRRMGVVRRPTGGRAVLHDRELTYSVVLPLRASGGLRPAYRRINEGLLAGLRRLGVDAALAAGRTRNPGSGPCFLDPAEGEVVVGGRKLVGSAQARIGGAILQHGSLLLVANQEALCAGRREEHRRRALKGNGASELSRPRLPATLAGVLGEVPPWERLVEALVCGFEGVFEGHWDGGSMTGGESALAARLQKRYGSREWTWRR